MNQHGTAPDSGSHYYSSLRGFEKLFQSGVPILTYHKLGPRRQKARIKGLYVSGSLFTRQLDELSRARFVTQPLKKVSQVGQVNQPSIVLTFDDGFRSVVEFGLEPLAANRYQAMQFLVAGLIGRTNEWEQKEGGVPEPLMDAAQVREWLAAGHEIGSHTLTHPWLTRLPAREAREEIVASKKKLEDLFGLAVEHFCYPYGDWNETVRDMVIEAGYQSACTTEFGINTPNTSPFAFKRITARYRSRNLKAWLARWPVFKSVFLRLRPGP